MPDVSSRLKTIALWTVEICLLIVFIALVFTGVIAVVICYLIVCQEPSKLLAYVILATFYLAVLLLTGVGAYRLGMKLLKKRAAFHTETPIVRAKVSLMQRFPLTTSVVTVYLVINELIFVIILFGNCLRSGAYDLSWIVMIPAMFLFALSHAILLGGGVFTIAIDVARFESKVSSGEAFPSNGSPIPIWILAMLAIPTVIEYASLSCIVFSPILGPIALQVTATPKEKANKALLEVLEKGYDKDRIGNCLNKGADVNALSTHGTALMLAAQAGDEVLVNELIRRGVDVNKTDRCLNTALIFALNNTGATGSRDDRRKVVLLLIKQKEAVSPQNSICSLSTAIKNNWGKDLIEAMLAAGAPVNGNPPPQVWPYPENPTPLMAAADTGNEKIAELLLKNGADPNTRQDNGSMATLDRGTTALMYAITKRHIDVARLLIENGADVNAEDSMGVPIIILAACQKSPELLNLLLKSGASVSVETACGDTVVAAAASSGDMRRVQQMLSLGAIIDPKGPSGVKALYSAIQGNNPKIVKFFIDSGVDVNAPQSTATRGNSLAWALMSKHTDSEIIRLLRAAGATEPQKFGVCQSG